MPKPLAVDILAYAPTAFYHCTSCEVVWREMGVSPCVHEEQLRSSLPADLAGQYQRLSDWCRALLSERGDQVAFRLVDAASVEGFFLALRHGIRKFPAIIVDRRLRFDAGALEDAGAEIARRLAPDAAARGRTPAAQP